MPKLSLKSKVATHITIIMNIIIMQVNAMQHASVQDALLIHTSNRESYPM